ncbi:RNA-directed DNA polymerase, eukaryota, reverse transcriptase zinc-binding domain protein, partial [Tanacetum coccineum]
MHGGCDSGGGEARGHMVFQHLSVSEVTTWVRDVHYYMGIYSARGQIITKMKLLPYVLVSPSALSTVANKTSDEKVNRLNEQLKSLNGHAVRSWEADREKERNERLDEMEGFVEDVLEEEGITTDNLVVDELKGASSSLQMILCLIENKQNHEKFCSFIYAANTGMERRILWKDLQLAKCLTNGTPWIIMGDFNVTLKLEEHSASSSIISCDMQEFIDCVNWIEVEDVCMTSMFYTWIKSLSNPSTSILKKLDKVTANEEFFNKYNQAFVVFHPFMISDHSPAILTIPNTMAKKKKSFKFANFVADKKKSMELVDKHWQEDIEGYHMFRVTKKLKFLKKHIKKLQWMNGDIFARVDILKSKLKNAQNDVCKFPFDSKKKELAVAILEEFNEALSDEEKFLSQKAKVDWLCEGDINSAYFHKVVKGRRNGNRVMSINNVMGDSVKGSKIADEFVKHFENFLGQAVLVQHLDSLGNIFTKTLTNEEADAMVKDVSEQEIKTTMFSIDDCKASGPDGYTTCFKKKAWSVIGSDVCLAVKEFFKSGKLLKEVNSTLVSLIPKVHHPKLVTEFRPIACCNVLYKCISKILTTRIKESLNNLVNLNQSAFIEGRNIQDNILLTQELLKGYNKKGGSKRCALKIDIAKAYDTVSWEFLMNVLIKFGFHRRMIDWIYTCISSSTFSICVNGEINGYFKGGRGLRHGDSISPYLFTLVMEVFTLIMAKKVDNSSVFKYHPGCKELKLTHLCFADDLLVICHGSEDSVKVIKDFIDEFSSVSGLEPNMNKSTILFGNVKNGLRDKAKEHIKYIVGNGKNISAWYDKWNEIGPLCQIIDIRDLYNARFDKNVTVPTLSDTHDKAMWRCNNGDLTKFTIRQTWNDYRGNYPEV